MSGHLPIHIFRRLPTCFCDDMKIFNHILVPPPKLQFGINVYWVIGKFKVHVSVLCFDSRNIYQISWQIVHCG